MNQKNNIRSIKPKSTDLHSAANHNFLLQTNPLPGSSSAAFARFEDCGHALVTLPEASSPQSRAEREKRKKKEDNDNDKIK